MKFYCFNRNKNYKEEIESIINSKKDEIFSFFGKSLENLDFDIYIYDTIDDLVNNMKKRGFKNIPPYMCACQRDEDNSINFFEPKDNPGPNEWSKDEYKKVIFHELIHAIQYNLYGKQPEWLTEGIAKYLDGTYSKGIKYLLENYIHKHKILSMDELENEFGMHDYDSYDYAYLIVSYLIETLGKEKFLEKLSNKNFSSNLILEAICYYNKKYFDDEFYNSDLLNPNWLFHGSPLLLDEINLNQSHDALGQKENIDKAVFLTSSKLIASAYAFKDSIKKNSEGLRYNFNINSHLEHPIMTMENVKIDENLYGYIYVFINDGSFKNEPIGSLQFKSYQKLNPIFCVKVYYKDYEQNYEIKKTL